MFLFDHERYRFEASSKDPQTDPDNIVHTISYHMSFLSSIARTAARTSPVMLSINADQCRFCYRCLREKFRRSWLAWSQPLDPRSLLTITLATRGTRHAGALFRRPESIVTSMIPHTTLSHKSCGVYYLDLSFLESLGVVRPLHYVHQFNAR